MTLAELEAAVSTLPPDELALFRKWFAAFDGELWDAQIEEDVRSGKLEALAEQALQQQRSGRTTPL